MYFLFLIMNGLVQQYEQRYKLPIVIVGDFNIAQNDDIHPQLFTVFSVFIYQGIERRREAHLFHRRRTRNANSIYGYLLFLLHIIRIDTYLDSYDVIRKQQENEKTTESSMIYSCWNQYKQHRSLNIGERYSFYFLVILASSIDYILFSKSLLPFLLESTILNTSSSLSDHAAICCSLSLVYHTFQFYFIRRWRRAHKPFVLHFIISK